MTIGVKIKKLFSRHRNRWLYFALLTLAGGLGSWITAGQHLSNPAKTTGYAFCASLGTFSISLAVMSLADLLVLSQNSRSLTRGLAVLLTVICSSLFGGMAVFELGVWTVLAAWISFTSAGAAWWGTHCVNSALDQSDPLEAMGGAV